MITWLEAAERDLRENPWNSREGQLLYWLGFFDGVGFYEGAEFMQQILKREGWFR